MRRKRIIVELSALACALLVLAFAQVAASAHCDGMDGPVVKAAQKALRTGNINLVLIWVGKGDEVEVREAFRKTAAVRRQSPQARELADRYFFGTLVRLHRAGEGEPFTGLKPARRDLGPVITGRRQGDRDGLGRRAAKAVHGGGPRGGHAPVPRGARQEELRPGRLRGRMGIRPTPDARTCIMPC